VRRRRSVTLRTGDKKVLKYLIASDIHGSAKYCGQLLQAISRENPGKIILLGDLLYHGPRNALPDGYDTSAVAASLNGLADRLICVRGNCDTEVDQMVLDFPILADYAYLELGGNTFFVTHGHRFGRNNPPPLRPGEALLCGHTHVPACEQFGANNLYLNPGSVSIPKGGSEHSYMTLEDGCLNWKTLDGTVYMTHSLPD